MKRLLLLFFVGVMSPAFSQIYSRVDAYYEGLAVVSGYTHVNGYSKKYGYVNEYNQLVIPLKYEHAEQFRNGAAIVGIGIKYGIINKAGKTILPIQYDDVRYEKELGDYSFKDKNGIGVIQPNGKIIVPCRYWSVERNTSILPGQMLLVGYQGSHEKDDVTCCIYDLDGKSLLPDGYTLAYEHGKFGKLNVKHFAHISKNGYCVVVKDERCGVYDLNAKRMVLNAEYDLVGLYDKFFLTVKNGLYGMVKTDGSIVCPNKFVKFKWNGHLLYFYNEEDEFVVYSSENYKEVLPLGCKEIDKKNYDHVVMYKGKYRFWDDRTEGNGQEVLYDTVIPICSKDIFGDGALFYIVQREGKYGLKNASLADVLPPEFDLMEFDDSNKALDNYGSFGLIHCKKDGKWGVFNNNRYTGLVSDAKMQLSDGILIAQEKGKYGFYNNGEIEFKYDAVPVALGENQWKVTKNGKYGLVTLFDNGGKCSVCSKYHIRVIMEPKGVFCENLAPVYDAITMLNDQGTKALTKSNGVCGFVVIPYCSHCLTPVTIPYEEARYLGVCNIEKQPTLFERVINKKYIPCEAFAVVKNGKKKYIGIRRDNSVVSITEPKRFEASSGIHARLVDSHWMLMANYGLSNVMEHSFGATLAWTNHFGGYVNVMTNGRMGIETDFSCTLDDQDEYFWTEEISTARLSVTAGALLPITEASYVYVGAGYGKRDLVWRTLSGQSVTMTPGTFSDFAMEGGLMFGLGKHGLLSIGGLVQTPSSYLEAKIGLGCKF